MNRKSRSVLLIFMTIPSLLWSCICYQVDNFDLLDYDESNFIVEVEIVKEVDQNPKILAKSDSENDFPVFALPSRMFQIRMLTIFKGETLEEYKYLKVEDINSSCSSTPKIGETYILYLKEKGIDNDEPHLKWVNCGRKLTREFVNYKNEFQSLLDLRDIKNGPIELEFQTGDGDLYSSLTGQMRNGERVGLWELKEPHILGNSKKYMNRLILELFYDKGHLVSNKYFDRKVSRYANDRFIAWFRYYDERTFMY